MCPDSTRLGEGLKAVRPVSFFGVPRVWERMAAGVQAYVAGADERVKAAFAAATGAALEAHRLREAKRPVPAELTTKLVGLDTAVLRPVRAMLGLDRVRWAGSGAAPIPARPPEPAPSTPPPTSAPGRWAAPTPAWRRSATAARTSPR
ncbi:hypothetical protein [Virgisporangium ochraceum]|uniref:hypothetical protein n=1 Tax=Virgisporangium ochraceum TaxID=65505 RepID=UPI00194092E2|nr:hypothetical protein [Virgisporangium ochraceum]